MSNDTLSRLAAALEGRYTIERELGEGGMATVYLADDLKHDRKVALKVLKTELAAVVGAGRFLAEIKTTANLQHPNILPLFDSGEADGFLYYVMPFVEGESLRDRLDREKQLPVEEAVRIASEVAEALHSAHEQGVIHRDIKPANILLSRGRPLVADFGIALAVSAAGGGRLTETGLSLGTPYYMSPEQASADREPSAGSDVYSLGCVLFEMLVGEPPHTGTTAQAVLVKILTGDVPDPTSARPSMPPHVDAAVRKSLERLPADRFANAHGFVEALANPGFRHGEVEDLAPEVASPWTGAAILPWGIAVVFAGAFLWTLLRPAPYVGPQEYDVAFPEAATLRLTFNAAFAVARDVSFLVYEGGGPTPQLWYRSLGTREARPIPETEGAWYPLISPDGQRIAFIQNGELVTSSPDGGARTRLAAVGNIQGGSWLPDGRLMLMDRDGLMVRWFDGYTETASNETWYCISPHPLPDSDLALCGGGGDKVGYTVDLTQAEERSVLRTSTGANLRGSDFRLVDQRYLLYMDMDGTLRGTSVDLATHEVGVSVALVEGVRRESYTGLGQFAVREDGTLLYVPGGNAEVGPLVRVGPEGDPTPLPIEPAAFLRFEMSPDGTRLAAVVEGAGAQVLRVYDVEDGWRYRDWLTAWTVWEPVWSPDGQRILVSVYEEASQPGATVFGLPESTTPPDTLFQNSIEWGFGGGFISENRILGHGEGGILTSYDLSTQPVTLEVLGETAEWFPALSPNGRTLAIGEWGTTRLGLEPFPSRSMRFDLSDDGVEPQWLSDTSLAFRSGSAGGFFLVEIDPATGRPRGAPRLWFTDERFADTPGESFIFGGAGSIIYKQAPSQEASHIRVIPNWVEQMKRAVDEANR